jgi:hypothetical protein
VSQGSINVPVVGPVTPTAFAGDINTALDALVSKNSGAAAPTNFPTTGGAGTIYQDWADTSPGGGITDEREFDGSNWLNKGAQDGTNHVWMPKVGGGSGTIAAAGTTDIGSVRASYMTVTGSSLSTPITSFGNNALLNTGETKFLRFTAAGIITNNAVSMILPGAADLSFNVGDSIQAVYLGGGNWLAYDYKSNISPPGRDTGDLFEKWGTGTIPGAVRLTGGTIGNGASGGTERANADTANLFIFLYIRDTTLTVSGGRTAPGNTRAAAITDFNLNKTLTLPNTGLVGTISRQRLLSGAAATYTTAANCIRLIARYLGAGGGGGGSTGAGTAGNDTIFNGVHAGGGGGGPASGGGGATGGTSATGSATLRIAGSDSFGNTVGGGGSLQQGWPGANSVFGGAGKGNGGAGSNAKTNSGSGGGGFGNGANNQAAGGAAGEYVELEIVNPAASYIYTVGTGGPGGSGTAGGTGGDGIIIVEEHCTLGQQYIAL